MHIAEGVLAPSILGVGAILAVSGTVYGLKKLSTDRLLTAGVLGAFFFVASLIHVPIGFTNAHLLGNGLIGVFLGFGAFPAILAALLLQALLLQFGGLTVLGVNTFSMASGAVLAYYVFKEILSLKPKMLGLKLAGLAAGIIGVLTSTLLTSLALMFTEEGFVTAAVALFLAHLPIMILEGVITMLTVTFVAKLKPEYLPLPENFTMGA